jgi:hypothetical protein
MRSIFAGLAVTVALSLGACGAKAPAEGKECKELFEKMEGWCKDAKDPIKGFCDSNKTSIEALKKVPVEASCTALIGAYKTIKNTASAVPAGVPATPTPSSTPVEVPPADGAGSAPTK